MSRVVIYETFGGPEVLQLREVPEPHAGPGEVRVRVAAVGLNSMDPALVRLPGLAAQFGVTLPAGFASDFAGVVDEVGPGTTGVSVGARVFGGAIAKAAAEHLVLAFPHPTLHPTPDGITDDVASTLSVAGTTAVAALDAIDLQAGDTVLIGGAAGGVGVFAVQLARLAGARVIGTASRGTFGFLRRLGAEPVAYGADLPDRVRALAPEGVSAAIDLFGTEVAEAGLALGVPRGRISTIAAGRNPPGAVLATGAGDAPPDALRRITEAIVAGELSVPIAATFPLEQIHDAVAMQASRHVHGKVVVAIRIPPTS